MGADKCLVGDLPVGEPAGDELGDARLGVREARQPVRWSRLSRRPVPVHHAEDAQPVPHPGHVAHRP